MKIAVLRKKYIFHGGAESFSGSFIEQLASGGHEVHIFAIKWQTDAAPENVHFHRVPAVTFNSFFRDLSFAVSAYFMLKKRRGEFDIIQSHDKTLYQDIYRAGDGCHIEWLKQRWKRTGAAGKASIVLNPYHWLILGIERSIFRQRRYRKIIAISEMVKQNIIENYGVPPDDIEVIYNGVDLVRFDPANRMKYRSEIRTRHGLSDRDPVVLFMGSGFERKGVGYLIQAVERLQEPVTALIVGKGPRKRSEQGRHRIIFCGPQKDNYRYYAAADIFVFPTIYEPFGNVHLEALASGLPVITTKNSGGAEIIRDGIHGYVIESPEDTAAVAEKISRLCNDRDLLNAMSMNARLLAEQFTFKKHIGKILDLYERTKQTDQCSRFRSS